MNSEQTTLTASTHTRRPAKRKTRITIYLDDDVLAQFRTESAARGMGYQTLINAALRHRLFMQQVESAER